tara:strand:- start:1619 stop:2554 length:936 start_codon:yes stop_codon:yes gene_type:complete
MEKSDLTPDPVRDPPVGKYQCPGGHMILPARAYGDTRFNQYPMTFRCFAICCAHANSWTGVFFVNQATISRILGSSQQAISQHMTRLKKYGYLEKLRNADIRRKYGRKGALWRVIYDPRMSYQDAIVKQPAKDRDPKLESEIAENTMAMVHQDTYKSKRKKAKDPVDNSDVNKVEVVQATASNESINKVDLKKEYKAQLVNNSNDITNNNTIDKNECRSICNSYKQLIYELWGSDWQYDLRQLAIAEDLLKIGYTKETFLADAKKMLQWKRNKSSPPIQSLQYFVSRRKNQEKPKDAQQIISHMANRMRLK